MRVIRASEIGVYLYCRRAWWYQKRGIPSENQILLAEGTELHYRHGRSVMVVGCLRALAIALILLALVLIAIYFTGKML